MKKVQDILNATSTVGAVVVVLTPDDRFDVDRECRAAAPNAEPISEANGAPIITARVKSSCVLRADLTINLLPW